MNAITKNEVENAMQAYDAVYARFMGGNATAEELNAAADVADGLAETFGEIISVYTRAQAIDDGVLVDMTEWASREKGFFGGYTCPVAMTAELFAEVKVEGTKKSGDTRGRAHDVLFLSSLALKGAMRRNEQSARFVVKLGRKNHVVRVVADGDGVTIGFPENF